MEPLPERLPGAIAGQGDEAASGGKGVVSIEEMMNALAADGWCVVLKRLPKEMGWIIEGARSEYDAPCEDKTVGVGKWLCEIQDMRYLKSGAAKYRHSRDAMADTPEEALVKAMHYAKE